MSPSWITAIAALVAAGGGVVTAAVGLSQLSTIHRDQQARQRHEHRAQAELVSGWVGGTADIEAPGDEVSVTIANQSTTAVFCMAIFLVAQRGRVPGSAEDLTKTGSPDDPPYRLFGVVPPGRHVLNVPWTGAGMLRRPAVELAFTDAAGVHWLRRASGELQESGEPPVRRFNLDMTTLQTSP